MEEVIAFGLQGTRPWKTFAKGRFSLEERMKKLISTLGAVLISIGTLGSIETASAAPMTIQQPVEISSTAQNPNLQTVHYRDRWERRHHRWHRRHHGWDRRHYGWRRHHRWERPRYYSDRPYYRTRDEWRDRPYRSRYRSGIYFEF
jgi:hypothetical protein